MKLGLKRGTVKLEPHDKRWEQEAEKTIGVLKKVLGEDATDIQHIGSTSITSISAKPIIDIVVGVKDLMLISKYNDELERQGIYFRGSDAERQLLYVMGDFEKDTRTHHIHVVIWNEKEWNDYVNFRDFLSYNAKIASQYQSLKENLESQYVNDRSAYTQGKQEMIDSILEQARQWRTSAGQRFYCKGDCTMSKVKDKMHTGELYFPGDGEIMEWQTKCLDRLYEFNMTRPTEGEKRQTMLKEMFAEIGEGCYIEPPFHSNFGGAHVHFGKNVYANFNLTCVDDTHIYVGDYTMFGPNVIVATAGHPILPEFREKGYQYNMPIHIGKNCWIGAGAIILPGITIGDNVVVGAGSVVTKDLPSNVVAVGNPCRVLREVSEHDKVYYFKNRKIEGGMGAVLEDLR